MSSNIYTDSVCFTRIGYLRNSKYISKYPLGEVQNDLTKTQTEVNRDVVCKFKGLRIDASKVLTLLKFFERVSIQQEKPNHS